MPFRLNVSKCAYALFICEPHTHTCMSTCLQPTYQSKVVSHTFSELRESKNERRRKRMENKPHTFADKSIAVLYWIGHGRLWPFTHAHIKTERCTTEKVSSFSHEYPHQHAFNANKMTAHTCEHIFWTHTHTYMCRAKHRRNNFHPCHSRYTLAHTNTHTHASVYRA